LAALIAERLNARWEVDATVVASAVDRSRIVAEISSASPDTVIYSPLDDRAPDFTPDLPAAEDVLGACAKSAVRNVVLVSSACAYAPDYHNPGLIRESRQPPARRPNGVADAWRAVEAMAGRFLGLDARTRIVILRPALSVVAEATDWASRLFQGRWAVTVAGFNPSIQLLREAELADAVCRAVVGEAKGVFNVAPDVVLPLRHALRAAGVLSISVPWTAQWLARRLLHRLGWSCSSDQQDYLRYSWTVSNERSKLELETADSGEVSDTTPPALAGTAAGGRQLGSPRRFDDFGMDENFIRVRSRRALGFMARRYWRIEARGLENVPREGRAVLVGIHRGFMPFDGVMIVHLLSREHVGRIPRFLMHPGLVKFPYIAPFLTNLGGIIACQENADYVLERDEILGVFPEGIRGAFRMYKDAYTLDRFGRSDFVKMALRHGAPIIPFVFLGTAETFPVLGKIESSIWKRFSEWPFIPITPTFPILPLPLPSKWHLQVLPPLPVHEMYSPADAGDPRVVSRIGSEVRDQMQRVLSAMRKRRRSIFHGSIFGEDLLPELSGNLVGQEFPVTVTQNQEVSTS
jgi:1-acyl-sn-glycerol-3-phosphate acyltransferase/nucleoside-diphosphate-sugar epimerase